MENYNPSLNNVFVDRKESKRRSSKRKREIAYERKPRNEKESKSENLIKKEKERKKGELNKGKKQRMRKKERKRKKRRPRTRSCKSSRIGSSFGRKPIPKRKPKRPTTTTTMTPLMTSLMTSPTGASTASAPWSWSKRSRTLRSTPTAKRMLTSATRPCTRFESWLEFLVRFKPNKFQLESNPCFKAM